jgi:hypothetical protein
MEDALVSRGLTILPRAKMRPLHLLPWEVRRSASLEWLTHVVSARPIQIYLAGR